MNKRDEEYQEHYSPDGEKMEYMMEHPEMTIEEKISKGEDFKGLEFVTFKKGGECKCCGSGGNEGGGDGGHCAHCPLGKGNK